jgi:hypothetical protein
VYLVEICGLGVHLIHRNTRCSTHSPAKCRRKFNILGRDLIIVAVVFFGSVPSPVSLPRQAAPQGADPPPFLYV